MVLVGLIIGALAAAGVIATGPMLGLVMLAGVAATVAVAYAPGVLFAAYLLIVFYKAALQPFSPVDITVVLALLNALQVVPLIADRRRREVSRAGTLLWVGLALLIVAGVLWAPDRDLALAHAATYWALVLLPILPAAARVSSDPRYVREFLWTFFGMGIVTVGLGLLQLTGTDRLVVLGMNTIQVSRAALLVPLLAVTFVLWERVPLVRPMAVALIPAALIVSLGSGSRGPLLVLVVIAALAALRAFARPREVNWRAAAVIACLAFVAIGVVSVVAADLPQSALGRFASLFDFIEGGGSGAAGGPAYDTSSETRVELFAVAVSLFESQPVLGVGTSGFEALSPRYVGPIEAGAYPHNAILQIASEFGLVGLALFAGLVLVAVARRLPPGGYARAVKVLLVFFLLNAMVSGDILQDRMTWGLLALVLLADVNRTDFGGDSILWRKSPGGSTP